MSRLVLTPQQIIPSYPVTPLTANAADFVFTPAGASFADGAGFTMTGREILLIQNLNVGAQTVTINSVMGEMNRTGNITAYSIGIAEFAVIPCLALAGWRQTDGQLYFSASAADVGFAVLRLPS
jgi:hypothetical protein